MSIFAYCMIEQAQQESYNRLMCEAAIFPEESEHHYGTLHMMSALIVAVGAAMDLQTHHVSAKLASMSSSTDCRVDTPGDHLGGVLIFTVTLRSKHILYLQLPVQYFFSTAVSLKLVLKQVIWFDRGRDG